MLIIFEARLSFWLTDLTRERVVGLTGAAIYAFSGGYNFLILTRLCLRFTAVCTMLGIMEKPARNLRGVYD